MFSASCTHGDVICPYSTAALVPWICSTEPVLAETTTTATHKDAPCCVPEFDLLDTDGDGFVSLTEFLAASSPLADQQARTAEFERVDTDRDGFISHKEYIAAYGSACKCIFSYPASRNALSSV